MKKVTRLDALTVSSSTPFKFLVVSNGPSSTVFGCRRSISFVREGTFTETACTQYPDISGTSILGRDLGTHCAHVSTQSFPSLVLIAHGHSESLYESSDLPLEARHSAALLASKVYYYLEEYDEALSFALGAGTAFQQDSNLPGDEEYVETLICG